MSEIRDYLISSRDGFDHIGLKIGEPSLDDYMRFKRGNFNIIIGHANVGKTTLQLYLMLLYSLKYNLKWWIFSIENKRESIYRRLCEFLASKQISKMSDHEIDKCLGFVQDHFAIADSEQLYSYKDVLNQAQIHIDTGGTIDGMLIDPYNALIKDRSMLKSIGSHEYDYEAASEMRLFCKKNNTTIFLNCHCHTDAMRKVHANNHEYAGLPMPPNMADVEGGGKWGNRADDVFAYHRYVHHPTDWMYSHIHVKKIKENETGGKPTPIDKPIVLRMLRNGCGFELNGKNLINGRDV